MSEKQVLNPQTKLEISPTGCLKASFWTALTTLLYCKDLLNMQAESRCCIVLSHNTNLIATFINNDSLLEQFLSPLPKLHVILPNATECAVKLIN